MSNFATLNFKKWIDGNRHLLKPLVSDPEQVDLEKAEKLIDSKLKLLLAPYTGQLAAAGNH